MVYKCNYLFFWSGYWLWKLINIFYHCDYVTITHLIPLHHDWLSTFTFIKRLLSSSSLSATRVVSSAYLRLLILLPAILIPACASSSPAFLMMYSAYTINKQGTEEPGRLQSMGSLSQTWLSDFTFTFHFHALEKEMATHSSVLVWRIPGTGEPGGLPSVGLHRVGHDGKARESQKNI